MADLSQLIHTPDSTMQICNRLLFACRILVCLIISYIAISEVLFNTKMIRRLNKSRALRPTIYRLWRRHDLDFFNQIPKSTLRYWEKSCSNRFGMQESGDEIETFQGIKYILFYRSRNIAVIYVSYTPNL